MVIPTFADIVSLQDFQFCPYLKSLLGLLDPMIARKASTRRVYYANIFPEGLCLVEIFFPFFRFSRSISKDIFIVASNFLFFAFIYISFGSMAFLRFIILYSKLPF